MDAIASLDPLIKAVYLMYKSDPQFLSHSIAEIVGISTMNVKRRVSDQSTSSSGSKSSRASRESKGSRKGILYRSRTSNEKPETLFLELVNKLDSLANGYDTEIKDLGMSTDEEQTFISMLLTFRNLYNTEEQDINKLVNDFQMVAAKEIHSRDPSNAAVHLVYLARFIDYLLMLKSSSQQKDTLIARRNEVCAKRFYPQMKIQDLPKFEVISRVYGVEFLHLNNRVLALKGECREVDIIYELETTDTKGHFKKSDFSDPGGYREWLQGKTLFFRKALDRFQQERIHFNVSKSFPRAVSPKNRYQTFNSVLDVFMSGSTMCPVCQEIIKDCMFVWQLDGYEVFMSVIKAYLRRRDYIEKDDALKLARTLLDFSGLPFKPEMWPVPIKSQIGITESLNAPIVRSVPPLMSELFNPTTLSEILARLEEVRRTSFFGIPERTKLIITQQFPILSKQRYKKMVSNIEKGPITLEKVSILLNYVVQDLQYLSDKIPLQYDTLWDFWTIKYDLAKRSLTDVKRMVSSLVPETIIDASGKWIRKHTTPTGTEIMKNILSCMILIRDLALFPLQDYSKIVEPYFYPDYYSQCQDWCLSMIEETSQVLQAETYSVKDSYYDKNIYSVFNIFLRYLSKVEQLKWTNKLQNASLFTLVYGTISNVLNEYTEHCTQDIIFQLQETNASSVNPVCYLKINNLYAMLRQLDGIFSEDMIETISSVMESSETKKGSRLVVLKVISAEILNGTFAPTSYVQISGCLNQRTRAIRGDWLPQWQEEFFVIIDNEGSQGLIFELVVNNNVVAEFAYDLDLDSTNVGTEKTLTLTKSNLISLKCSYWYEQMSPDPLHFSGMTRVRLIASTQRIIPFLSLDLTERIKSLFTKAALLEMKATNLETYKVGDFLEAEDNPDRILDKSVVEICDHIDIKVSQLKPVLDCLAINDMMIYIWSQIVQCAIELVIPSPAYLSKIRCKHDDLCSMMESMGTASVSPIALAADDFERVVSWVYRLFAGVCSYLPSEQHNLLLTGDFYGFLKLRSLYHQTLSDIQKEYKLCVDRCESLLRFQVGSGTNVDVSRSIVRQSTKKRRNELLQEETDLRMENLAFTMREIFLRLMFAKDGSRSIEYICQSMDEYDRLTNDIRAGEKKGSKRSSRINSPI
ncbi:hypothetical protein KL935_000992 [Ogataea polymorpha]|uniref:uncharacterized protein n=1 Tax=Ogataea polymorpha TaxID=460523 RepID=UPI0007F382E6|nr:uncharacterized protein OGAPODRAFT_11546 [Ogataea polymorpha]KAG7903460.1 hypothetical protein KL935_000992 [Ogataea polymorpha]KAG7911935.1 hypothetical protein KL906_000139 [Ogataea polymorpha]KAG7920300.1 hypothetical protein KL927_000980 [Ogataea polymorpha]KAG7938407.1 hypothetical protein KL934_000981 [Ogataea polymorpha]OBA17167.1 hypothetical protein OGAPODRAFT_11546 [Ogataea polymorpha]